MKNRIFLSALMLTMITAYAAHVGVEVKGDDKKARLNQLFSAIAQADVGQVAKLADGDIVNLRNKNYSPLGLAHMRFHDTMRPEYAHIMNILGQRGATVQFNKLRDYSPDDY